MTAEAARGAKLIVLSGLAGSGKSTIAAALGRALRIPVLSVDPIESGIVAAGIAPSFKTGLAAYLVASVVAEHQLAVGLSVVVDAANYVEEGRNVWRRLAKRAAVEMRVIVVEVGPDERRSRLHRRNRRLAIAEPDLAFADMQEHEWRPWREPHLTLDGGSDVEISVERAIAFVDRGT